MLRRTHLCGAGVHWTLRAGTLDALACLSILPRFVLACWMRSYVSSCLFGIMSWPKRDAARLEPWLLSRALRMRGVCHRCCIPGRPRTMAGQEIAPRSTQNLERVAKSIKARARSLRQSGEDGFACDGKSKLTNPYSKDTTACSDDEPLQQPPPPKRTKTSSSDQQLCLKPQQMPMRICRRRSDVRGERLGGFTGLEYRRMRRAGLPVWCSWEPSKRATRFL